MVQRCNLIWGYESYNICLPLKEIISIYPSCLSRLSKPTRILICNFCYTKPNFSPLRSILSQHALLIGSYVRQQNGILLGELQWGQHFWVAILRRGYEVYLTYIYLVYIMLVNKTLVLPYANIICNQTKLMLN